MSFVRFVDVLSLRPSAVAPPRSQLKIDSELRTSIMRSSVAVVMLLSLATTFAFHLSRAPLYRPLRSGGHAVLYKMCASMDDIALMSYRDLQAACKAAGLSAKGKADELRGKLLELAPAADSSADPSPPSPSSSLPSSPAAASPTPSAAAPGGDASSSSSFVIDEKSSVVDTPAQEAPAATPPNVRRRRVGQQPDFGWATQVSGGRTNTIGLN